MKLLVFFVERGCGHAGGCTKKVFAHHDQNAHKFNKSSQKHKRQEIVQITTMDCFDRRPRQDRHTKFVPREKHRLPPQLCVCELGGSVWIPLCAFRTPWLPNLVILRHILIRIVIHMGHSLTKRSLLGCGSTNQVRKIGAVH